MKKRIIKFQIVLGFLFLFSPLTVFAQSNSTNTTPTTTSIINETFAQIPCISKYCTLEQVVNAAISIIRPLFILTFGAMIMYGGWVRMTSRGNPDKIKSSSQIIVAAIVGFSIAVLAPTLSDFILRLLGVTL